MNSERARDMRVARTGEILGRRCMKVVSSEQMREIDGKIISDFNVPGEALMDMAGRGVAEIVRALADLKGMRDASVRLFAGHGNNGGDAYVVARYLKRWGFDLQVFQAGVLSSVKGDALTHLKLMQSAGIEISELLSDSDFLNLQASDSQEFGFVVDALLGTGTVGSAREPIAAVIRQINQLAARNVVVAIDVPSGLNADTGEPSGDVVVADVTATVGLPKRGLVAPTAIKHVGIVKVVDIGVSSELISDVESNLELIASADLAPLFSFRQRDGHKGTFGHILVLSGSAGYSGAPALVAGAAVRSGVGLVTVLTPRDCVTAVATLVPEAMVCSASGSDFGCMDADAIDGLPRGFNEFDAVVVGPGLCTAPGAVALVERILRECEKPLVMDADALNVCCGRADLISTASCPVVITPHPGEMGRLLSCSTVDVQSDRIKMAEKAAAELNAVTVLKGAGTVVAATGKQTSVNMTGNSGMATGGMGDVLAGLIGGLLAQGLAPFDSACAGVYLHGSAGDRAAWQSSQAGLTATALINELPHTFKDLTVR